MKNNRLLSLAFLAAAAGIVAFTIIRTRAPGEPSREPGKPVPVNRKRLTNRIFLLNIRSPILVA